MNMWEAIVLIVVVVSLARAWRGHRLGAQPYERVHSAAGGDAPPPAATRTAHMGAADMADLADMQREIETLRQRVQVLERIVTEDRQSRELADEIEALRKR